jgi:putative transposase
MQNQTYPTDLTDRQWDCIKELIPHAKPGGRPRTVDMRQVMNAILYIVVTGVQWRLLPKDYPAWQTVYTYFRRWRDDGSWQRIHDTLRAQVRRASGRHKHPTAGCLDSQSVKVAHITGVRGFDGAKKISGRKRHLLVDTIGLLMVVIVTSAGLSDGAGARMLLAHLSPSCKKLRRIWVDGGYKRGVRTWAMKVVGLVLDVVLRSDTDARFRVVLRRWVVERTIAWLSQCRRLSKDYERLPISSEAWIYIAMTRLMLRRLAS